MDTKVTGSISELNVASCLMEMDVMVSRPLTESCLYDLVVDDDGDLYRVQVKTGRLRNGSVVFNCVRTHSNTSQVRIRGYSEEVVDAFAVYSPDLDEVYWVDICEIPNTEMCLRVTEPEQADASINWAEEYKVEDIFDN